MVYKAIDFKVTGNGNCLSEWRSIQLASHYSVGANLAGTGVYCLCVTL